MGLYSTTYKYAQNHPEEFWSEAAEQLVWQRRWDKVLDDNNSPFTKWFSGGKINTCYNALDVHVAAGRGEQAAIIYDSPVTETKEILSYNDLYERVSAFAGVLVKYGVTYGDRVIIYMPMIPETVIAMLACTRIGAIHSVVFGGFASNELAKRIDDAKPKLIVSASCGIEPGRVVSYKPLLNGALALAKHQPDKCIIVQRKMEQAELDHQRDIDWFDAHTGSNPVGCVEVNALDPVYILYTSGTTGVPKGVVRPTGGHLVSLKWSMKNIFNVNPGDVYWAASDVGWVVGHSYIVYAPLFHGCTSILYEGKPVGTPDAGAFWRVISEHKVSCMFTAPTAMRAIKKEDPKGNLIEKYDMSFLQSQFLAGERCDPDTLQWTEELLKVPVIDHWWQTETGWPVCSSFPGMKELETKEGSCGMPCPGWDVKALDEEGSVVDPGEEGSLVFRSPLPPGSLSTVWGDEKRFQDSYWKRFPGFYLTGDSGYFDKDGFAYVMGRTDDVINVAGHRLSTGRMEEVLAAYSAVAECAVVAKKDQDKGEIPVGFVILNLGFNAKEKEVMESLVGLMRESVGAFPNFKLIILVEKLPKTRSGKILRRLLRSMIDGETYSIPSTIEDPSVIKHIETELSRTASQGNANL